MYPYKQTFEDGAQVHHQIKILLPHGKLLDVVADFEMCQSRLVGKDSQKRSTDNKYRLIPHFSGTSLKLWQASQRAV